MDKLLAVLAHETRDVAKSRALLFAWLVFVALLVYAVIGGRARADAQRLDLERLVALENELLAVNAQKLIDARVPGAAFAARLFADPHWVGVRHGVKSALLPVGGAAAFAAPPDALASDAVRVTTARLALEAGTTTVANPTLAAFGALDLVFVLCVWLPLLALVWSHGLLAGERERGTGVLLAASPVGAGVLLVGKLAPRFVLLFVPCVVALVCAAPDEPLAVALAACAVGLVLLVWLLGAALLDLTPLHSATAALVLLGAWLVAVVAWPAAARAFAVAAHPTPSAATAVAVEREAASAAEARRAELLGEFMSDHPELSARAAEHGVAEYKQSFWATQAAIEGKLLPLERAREQALAARAASEAKAALASPPAALRALLVELAGRGPQRAEAFRAAVREHHAAWRAWFEPRVFSDAPLEPGELDGAPRFVFVEESDSAALAAARMPLIVLAAQVLALFALVFALKRSWSPLQN
jgi:ABC-2 type transport system permease protein